MAKTPMTLRGAELLRAPTGSVNGAPFDSEGGPRLFIR